MAASAAIFFIITSGAWAAAPTYLTDPADQWLPHVKDATWTYEWFDTQYAPTPTREKYTVGEVKDTAFRLQWTTQDLGNPDDAVDSSGIIDYQHTDAGLINLNWNSTPPPPQFPVLCASGSQCANSMASTHYMLIWGNRSPVLLEPLLAGSRWSALGGANNDVSSDSRYLGREVVKVPAFPEGIMAAKVQTEVTQAGALGDPWGSGVRTVWWVRGIGPVRVIYSHTGGDSTEALLDATTLTAKPLPPDESYLPLNTGDTMRYRWTNDKHMRKPSVQDVTVQQVVNNTARVDVASVKGPIRLKGAYVFTTRLSGIVNLSGATSSQTKLKFPTLGPPGPKARRRHLLTPLDLMVYGFNPVLPAYPAPNNAWSGTKLGRDYDVYGVTGLTRVLGFDTIKTALGKLRCLVVRSDLEQKRFPYGSGRRTAWFAPGKGLVRLVFHHRDGSTSRVDRLS